MRPITRRRAFTLLEITLVLAIIGALMAVAAVSITGSSRRANVSTTKASLRTIGNAIQEYHLNNQSNYPATLGALVTGDYLEEGSLTDAWGMAFYFQPSPTADGRPFQLLSAGPDKELGTPDDINYWDVRAGR